MVRGHAEALMPLMARVMSQSRLEFAELDRIAVTVGPGSFTGLRVGVAAARGIALAAGKPAVGLTTLAAFAAPHVAADDEMSADLGDRCAPRPGLLQMFGPGGRTIIQPRIATVRDAVRAASAGPARSSAPAPIWSRRPGRPAIRRRR